MSLYAIGDFHLSFTVNKPMDVFDKRWKNHVVKIEKYWKKKVTENDTVVITGDHSWGRDLAECQADLDFIMNLPARRIWILLWLCRAGRFCFGEITICSGMRRRQKI